MTDNKMDKNNNQQAETESNEAYETKKSETGKQEVKAEKQEKHAGEEGKKEKKKKDKKEQKIADLEEKLKDLTDKHIRLQAEFDNFRKRTVKEKTELIKSGGESVLTGILPIVDDFERAIQSLKEIPEDDPGKKGTLLIYSKFREFLKQNNVKEIEAMHQDFDVDHHEALTKIPAENKKLKGKVVDVIQKGYTLNDKVIRYAKVVVGE